MARPMTPHEKECALAAIALRLEKAKTTAERKEWRAFLREVKEAVLCYDDGELIGQRSSEGLSG